MSVANDLTIARRRDRLFYTGMAVSVALTWRVSCMTSSPADVSIALHFGEVS